MIDNPSYDFCSWLWGPRLLRTNAFAENNMKRQVFKTEKNSESFRDLLRQPEPFKKPKSRNQNHFKNVIWWCSVLLFSPPEIYLMHIAGQETMKLSREFLLKTKTWARYTKIEVWGFPSSRNWGAKVLDKKGGSKNDFLHFLCHQEICCTDSKTKKLSRKSLKSRGNFFIHLTILRSKN